jgi:multidrug resistance efflux pump
MVATNDVTISGQIRPQHVTAVSATASGVVEAFLVDVGQEVYEGQLLARIGAQGVESAREVAASALEKAQEAVNKAEAGVSSARLEASRADANAQRSQMALDRARNNFSHQRTLFVEGATPRATYEKAEQDYESAQRDFDVMNNAMRLAAENVQSALQEVSNAKRIVDDKNRELEEAQANLQDAEVHSPVDGLVVARSGEAGKPAGGELFEIATDLYALEVAAEAPEAVLKRLHPGQQALVLVLDLQSAGMPGAVKTIKDNQVIVEFSSTMPAIKPGMLASVRLKLD